MDGLMMACGREMGCLKETLVLWASTFLAGTCSGDLMDRMELSKRPVEQVRFRGSTLGSNVLY